jgi:hypothetical protein
MTSSTVSKLGALRAQPLMEDATKRGGEQILTTHTGSLPRPPSLVRLLFDKDKARPTTRPSSTARSRPQSPRR